MDGNQEFLGTGWSFPPVFSRASKSVEMVSGIEDIRQSLEIILGTILTERQMEPNFGCNLDEFLFEPLDTSLKTVMSQRISKAIINYETRVQLDKVTLDSESTEGIVYIDVAYTIRATNTRTNLVYPFYLNEATDANP